MKLEVTSAAEDVIGEVAKHRTGNLVVTIGTGCCESTAPYLYEDYELPADSVKVGTAAGLDIWAPAWLADKYGPDELVLDAERNVTSETFSLEAEIDARLLLLTRAQTQREGE